MTARFLKGLIQRRVIEGCAIGHVDLWQYDARQRPPAAARSMPCHAGRQGAGSSIVMNTLLGSGL